MREERRGTAMAGIAAVVVDVPVQPGRHRNQAHKQNQDAEQRREGAAGGRRVWLRGCHRMVADFRCSKAVKQGGWPDEGERGVRFRTSFAAFDR